MDVPLWARVVLGAGVATAVAFAATPVAIVAARWLAFFDRPSGYKAHTSPTPYLGGAAVVAAFAAALILGAGQPVRTLPLLAGVLVLFVTGTIDDRRTVPPQTRVAIEFALGILVTRAGLGWRLGAGQIPDILVNGLWIVAVVNAFNLFDNMDGAASTMAFVTAAGACVLALVSHDHWVVVGCAALCGACLGFLPHNLARPARIFLGDGGSMPLGFAVAVLVASAARSTEPSLLALVVGFLLVGIPALDTALVIVSRRRRGVSFLTGGQDHLTHRTKRRMRTARRVALVLGSVQAVVSALVIVATRESSAVLIYAVLGFVVFATVAVVGLEEAELAPAQTTAAQSPLPRVAPTWLPAKTRSSAVALIAAALVGLGAGLSAFFSAYYDVGVWVPLGLGVTIAAAAAAVARPPRATLPIVLSLTGLAGLGLWSLLSTGWTTGDEAATVDANRWLSYAALFLLFVVLVRGRRRTEALLLAIGLGIALVALSVLIRMFGSDPGALFLGGRLNSPLGYINGEGCLFAVGAWGAVALAERRQPIAAGMGAAAAVALASLALLTQSRGAAIATLAALVMVLGVVPGRRRRVIALAAIGAGFAAAAAPVLHVYANSSGGAVAPSAAHRAAVAIFLASVCTGIIWGVVIATARVVERDPSRAAVLRQLASGLAILLAAGLIIAGAVALPSIRRTVDRQWHAFVHLSDTGSSSGLADTRLFSGAGNRYDYWRIAWRAFEQHPVGGIGAGNYPTAYFAHRSTQEAIQNPHSIELQTLSELGLVGIGLLLMLLAGVAVGVARLRRVAIGSASARTVLVAALGGFVVWLVDTSGDWMHLLPGLTAIALAGAAVLTRDWRTEVTNPPAPAGGGTRMPMLIGAGALAFSLAVTGAGLARAALVRHYLDNARAELATRPTSAITDARRALRLDHADLDAYYVEAAGKARFDEASAAYATLLAAAREDPSSFVTWTLLGDLEVRLRNFAAARTFYGRGHALDPRDPQLARLARNPASALTGSGG